MTRLYLVKAFDGGPLPTYRVHEGHSVIWRPWRPPIPLTHVVLSCSSCGADGQVWSATGAIRRAVPTWPVAQLIAFRCSLCMDTAVFDMGRSGAEWTEIDIEAAAVR